MLTGFESKTMRSALKVANKLLKDLNQKIMEIGSDGVFKNFWIKSVIAVEPCKNSPKLQKII